MDCLPVTNSVNLGGPLLNTYTVLLRRRKQRSVNVIRFCEQNHVPAQMLESNMQVI